MGDIGATMTVLNYYNSVFRITGHSSFGGEDNAYRFCCEKGQIEHVRGTEGKIMLRYNPWQTPEGKASVNFYTPEWDEADRDIASRLGHNGGDYFIIKKFFSCIRGEEENVFDVYFATTMASVGILAHRSLLQKGVPYDIPDFRKEKDRKLWENDTLTPFWTNNGTTPPSIPCCSRTDYHPSQEAQDFYYKPLEEVVFE